MTFTDWLDENREELLELHRNDYEEALFKAFMAGMDHMGECMKNLKIFQKSEWLA